MLVFKKRIRPCQRLRETINTFVPSRTNIKFIIHMTEKWQILKTKVLS